MGGLSAATCFQKKTLFQKKIHNSPTKNASFNDVLIFGNNSAMDTSFEKSSSHFEQQIHNDPAQAVSSFERIPMEVHIINIQGVF